MSPDRSAVLRRAAAAGLVIPLLGLSGCDPAPPGAPDAPAGGVGDGAPPASRPLLQPWSDGAVYLPSPPNERPLAYLSVQERRLYVDPDHRDRVQRLLGAYISVTTGYWRIQLLGDDPMVPVLPGDERREFEEVDLKDWDPATLPSVGDVRVRLGAPAPMTVALVCTPVLGGVGWVSAPPRSVERVRGTGGDGEREYFGEVARGALHTDRACADAGLPVRILSWATRGSVSPPTPGAG